MDFLHLPSIVGGALVGLASVTLLYGSGRIAGISGILGGLVEGNGDRPLQVAFLGGLVAVGIIAALVFPSGVPERPASTGALIVAGLLVGFGTRLGNGCTSGHGICGVGRFSPRSLVSTAVFVGIGMATVAAMQAVLGAP